MQLLLNFINKVYYAKIEGFWRRHFRSRRHRIKRFFGRSNSIAWFYVSLTFNRFYFYTLIRLFMELNFWLLVFNFEIEKRPKWLGFDIWKASDTKSSTQNLMSLSVFSPEKFGKSVKLNFWIINTFWSTLLTD